MRTVLTAALVAALSPAALGGPVVVDLPDRATVPRRLVTVGDVARVTGGDPATRDRVLALDVAEWRPRDPAVAVTRRAVEYRVRLAGLDPSQVVVTGADRVTVAVATRPVSADEVVAAARADLVRALPWDPDLTTVDLAVPVAVRLPEVPAGEPVAIAARPHTRVTGPGRVQVDVTVAAAGETLLAFPVHFEVRVAGAAAPPPLPQVPASALTPGAMRPPMPIPRPPQPVRPGALPAWPDPGPVLPAGGTTPPGATPPAGAIPPLTRIPPAAGLPPLTAAGPAAVGVAVQARQPVTLVYRSGELVVTAPGVAGQPGRVGDTIPVQNASSGAPLSGRVTGPGTVEVGTGGQQP